MLAPTAAPNLRESYQEPYFQYETLKKMSNITSFAKICTVAVADNHLQFASSPKLLNGGVIEGKKKRYEADGSCVVGFEEIRLEISACEFRPSYFGELVFASLGTLCPQWSNNIAPRLKK